MSSIIMEWFGGMIPRLGEEHLAQIGGEPNVFAVDAENTNLYSGELRPLVRPSLAHTFCSPGDDWRRGSTHRPHHETVQRGDDGCHR